MVDGALHTVVIDVKILLLQIQDGIAIAVDYGNGNDDLAGASLNRLAFLPYLSTLSGRPVRAEKLRSRCVTGEGQNQAEHSKYEPVFDSKPKAMLFVPSTFRGTAIRTIYRHRPRPFTSASSELDRQVPPSLGERG